MLANRHPYAEDAGRARAIASFLRVGKTHMPRLNFTAPWIVLIAIVFGFCGILRAQSECRPNVVFTNSAFNSEAGDPLESPISAHHVTDLRID